MTHIKSPKPPKKIKHPELWWNAVHDAPRIIYPDGSVDMFDVGEWRLRSRQYFWVGNPPALAREVYHFEFIAELK